MSDDLPDGSESDIRRRAAWLLAMLVLVAALFVTVFVTFFNGSTGDGNNNGNLANPTNPVGPNPTGSPTSPTKPSGTGAPSSGSTSGSPSGSASSTGTKTASCPNTDPCALDSDIGSAIAAINAYRTSSGKSAVPGAVSEAAKRCALQNGSGCSGGWAETQVDKPDGPAAVKKIQQFGKLTSDMKSIEVGWAYDPKAKQYYFAIIRKG